MQKTLVFGGAFDPPHIEHVNACKSAMAQLGIDKVVLVPTYSPPHKKTGYLDYDVRCELIKRAFEGVNFVIDTIEYDRKSDNYSAKILPILKEKYGDIIYLIGGDSLEYLSKWYHPEIVVAVCPIAVVAREGYDDRDDVIANLKSSIGGQYIKIDYQGKDVASSMIRAKLLLGERPLEISQSVYDYIKENHLFEEYKWAVDKVHSFQSEDLFVHSKAVVLTAIDLNSKHNLKQDFDKLFLATLLHDNAKQRPSLDGLDIPIESVGTPVLHQFLGAEKAKRDFGIEDDDILNAIRYHTTAKADMTTFEKLVYTADSVSFDRQYDPIPAIRDIAMRDFDKGFLEVLRYTYDKVAKTSDNIYKETVDAKEFYLD